MGVWPQVAEVALRPAQGTPVLDDVVFAVAQVEVVQVPTISGRIQPILYWYEGLGNWTELNPTATPSVPQGTAFYIAVGWINGSNVSIRGHIDLTITRPDGTQVVPVATSQQDEVAAPGDGWIVAYEPIILDQVGAYQGRATLSGVGT